MSELERRTHDEAGNRYGELKPSNNEYPDYLDQITKLRAAKKVMDEVLYEHLGTLKFTLTTKRKGYVMEGTLQLTRDNMAAIWKMIEDGVTHE